MDWNRFYFWELFGLDVLTVLGFLGVLASIPIGMFIENRLRRIVVIGKAYYNRDNRQSYPKQPKSPCFPIEKTSSQGSQCKANHYACHDAPILVSGFISHITRIIKKVKNLCQRK